MSIGHVPPGVDTVTTEGAQGYVLLGCEEPIANAVPRPEHESADFQGEFFAAVSALERFSRAAGLEVVATTFQAANTIGPPYFLEALFTGRFVYKPQAYAARR